VTGAAIGEAIREQRETILRVAAKHGATQVRLIGSVARGDARPDSDVDLLVMWQQGTSLLDQAALKLELEGLLGRKVDIASDGWVKPSIRESVYRDAIVL
jgi:predicted nucleotidyltransferase